ncbi:hypothetical protein Tco_1185983 [Tanacetum coccineum]
MYIVDMKNIVPKESLTCLVAKATLDESMLWHREGWFLEDKPIVSGDGRKCLFDIDSLTKSMDYVPVIAGTNSNDFAGSDVSIGKGTTSKETNTSQDYIVMPLWKDSLLFDSPSMNVSHDEPEPSYDAKRRHEEGVKTGSLILMNVSPTVLTTRSNNPQSVSDIISLRDNEEGTQKVTKDLNDSAWVEACKKSFYSCAFKRFRIEGHKTCFLAYALPLWDSWCIKGCNSAVFMVVKALLGVCIKLQEHCMDLAIDTMAMDIFLALQEGELCLEFEKLRHGIFVELVLRVNDWYHWMYLTSSRPDIMFVIRNLYDIGYPYTRLGHDALAILSERKMGSSSKRISRSVCLVGRSFRSFFLMFLAKSLSLEYEHVAMNLTLLEQIQVSDIPMLLKADISLLVCLINRTFSKQKTRLE